MADAGERRTMQAVAEAERLATASNAASQALQTLTDLFFEHERSSVTPMPAHFTKLVLGLLPRVSPGERAQFARRVAHSDTLPPEIAAALAEDELEVAGPVLRQSPSLAPEALMAAARGSDPERARAVAARTNLPRDIRVALAGRGETPVAEEMLSGPAYPIEPEVAELLAGTAALSQAATARLVDWSELSFPALAGLFWSADPATRRIVVERAARRAAEGAAPKGPSADRGLGSELFAAAASRRSSDMTARIAGALGLPRSLAARLVEDESGEALVVGCRAAGVGVSQLTSLLVLLPFPGSASDSQARIRDLVSMAENLPTHVAASLVRCWSGGSGARTPRHEPAVVAGQRPTSRHSARPAETARGGAAVPERTKVGG